MLEDRRRLYVEVSEVPVAALDQWTQRWSRSDLQTRHDNQRRWQPAKQAQQADSLGARNMLHSVAHRLMDGPEKLVANGKIATLAQGTRAKQPGHLVEYLQALHGLQLP